MREEERFGILLRLPVSLARGLAAEAKEQGISRTELIVKRLQGGNRSPAVPESPGDSRSVITHRAQATPPAPPSNCLHGRAKVLKLKTCEDCGRSL